MLVVWLSSFPDVKKKNNFTKLQLRASNLQRSNNKNDYSTHVHVIKNTQPPQLITTTCSAQTVHFDYMMYRALSSLDP